MRKVHINRFEIPGGWTNGDGFPVFDFVTPTGALRGGIMICYDSEVPESARLLMLQGADVIFNPTACRCPTDEIRRCILRARAFENECYLFMVNQAGPAQNGHSFVVDYRGDIVCEAGTGEEVFTKALDLEALKSYRQQSWYAAKHRRPELYGLLTDPRGQAHPPAAP